MKAISLGSSSSALRSFRNLLSGSKTMIRMNSLTFMTIEAKAELGKFKNDLMTMK